tara:strand:+ start:12450 stop:13028 length:579 start_codon:yes stop_codon:yes gene_type:complete
MEQKFLGFSQTTFGGWLACTSVSTVFAAAMADNDEIRCFSFDDVPRLRFLTEFACGLWRESSQRITDESVSDVVGKHVFFKSGEVYDTDGWAGRFGENDDERRISLSEFIVEIEKIHKEKGSLGVVFTDNVVSFACGMIGGEWVLYDSHAPASCCATLRGTNATLENIERMIASHFVRNNGIFDATMFTRKK